MSADVHVLDYDGGLVDASCMAVIAALQHFKRPDIRVVGEEVTVFTLDERVPVPLSILHHPLCVTLSFFNSGNVVLVDATLQEQQLSEGEMIVTANKYGEICQIAKLGGVPIDALVLLNCMGIALRKVVELDKITANAFERDRKQQTNAVIERELRAENER